MAHPSPQYKAFRLTSKAQRGKWLYRADLHFPLKTWKIIASIKDEWNTSAASALQRIVEHYMLCTGRARGNYRKRSSLIEDKFCPAPEIAPATKAEIISITRPDAAIDTKTFDSQIKEKMRDLT
jgi:hypothetical protein